MRSCDLVEKVQPEIIGVGHHKQTVNDDEGCGSSGEEGLQSALHDIVLIACLSINDNYIS